MKAIVIGATGTIGKAVADVLKSNNYEVTAASRKSQPSIDMTDTKSIEAFFDVTGPVDVIVTAAGDAAFVELDKLTEDDIQLSLTSKLMGQINVVRKGLSKLKPNGVFVITGGILAYTPGPQTSMIAMVNAGLEGFAKAAALDLTEGRRIVVVHPPWIAETARALGMDASQWPDAATAAHAYLEAINSGQTGKAIFVKGYEPSAQ